MPTGCFHPYWKPGSQGTCSPFTIPAVLKSVYTNRKNGVCIYTSQNTKIPTVDPPTERKDCGDFQCRIQRSGRNSCVMHRCGVASFRTRIRVPAHILIRLVQRLSLPYHRNYTFLLHLIKPKNAKITIVVSARRYFGYRLAEMHCASRPNNAGISRIPV